MRVGDQKIVDDAGVFLIGDVQVFLNRRGQQAENIAVNVVQQRRHEEGERDKPAQIWNFEFHDAVFTRFCNNKSDSFQM